MGDHVEEQEMEAEAMAAIFDTHFTIVQGETQPFQWKVELWPEATSDEEGVNHVGIDLFTTLPLQYPDDDEAHLPELSIEIKKGLTQDHANELLALAKEEAVSNLGTPSMFAICERLREWLVENNKKGLDDISMHAQMLRRKAEQERQEQQQQQTQQFESQKAQAEMSQAELEDLELRRKRAEGTPVNDETFATWKRKFDQEMKIMQEQIKVDDELASGKTSKKARSGAQQKDREEDLKKGRLSGKEQFSDKAFNLEALEAAAENAEADPDEEEDDDDEDESGEENGENGGGINEELFDVDDEDLDDLEFDDDDDDEEDEQVDI